MKLLIKRISDTDWETYKSLRLESLKLAPEAFGSKYSDNILIYDEEWKKRVSRFASSSEACNFIAWINGTAAGMETCIKEKQPSMFQMWVNPLHRKQGIAEKLVLHLQQWIKDQGQNLLVCSVYKSNKAALDLYLRLGFSQTHEDDQELHQKWEF